MTEIPVDIIIIGAGPAGLAAAIAAKKAGIDSLIVFERDEIPGGILNQCIHTGFGLHRFKVELTGPEYAHRDVVEAEKLGIDIRLGVTVLDLNQDKIVTCISHEKGLEKYKAKAVILAMGCRERPRGALATPGTRPAGVYAAGTAQKFLNMQGYMPGNNIVILGSGDIGLIMARRMVLQGANVLACIEIMPYSSGLNRNIVQCLEDFNIPLYLEHTVVDIKGKNRLESVIVAKVDSSRTPIPGSEFEIPCDTLLLSVGLIPENELTDCAQAEMSRVTSGPVVNSHFETSVEGIFACGNVLHVHDLVDYVSSESAAAGEKAAEYVLGKRDTSKLIDVVDGKGVRGCVPQKIFIDDKQGIDLMFRPDNVYKNHYLTLTAGDKVLMSQRKMILAPGEMVNVRLNEDKLSLISEGEELVVSITPEKAG
ncbi:MAG: FAD-dependent oxidoreductase [Christensenellaceae bacterium]|nr:FAD-dependent oxidoreductase [Christensenellaceae bacterium]